MRTTLSLLLLTFAACASTPPAPDPEPAPAKDPSAAAEPAPPQIAPRPPVDTSKLTAEQNVQRQRIEAAARSQAEEGEKLLTARDYDRAIASLQSSLETIRRAPEDLPLDIGDLENRVTTMLYRARADKRAAAVDASLRRTRDQAREAREDEREKRGW